MCFFYCFIQKPVVCRRRKSSRKAVLMSIGGICTGANSQNHISYIHMILKGSCGPNANDLIYIIKMKQLIAVNTHGRHSHSGSHNRNLLSMISSCIAQHVSHCIKADRSFQISFCNIFCPQRISRHQNSPGNISFLRGIMRCWYTHSYPSFFI